MSTKTYLLLYHKTIAKETAFSPINQPEKHHHGIFSHVGLRLGGGGLATIMGICMWLISGCSQLKI
jgi:hypothetical protein